MASVLDICNLALAQLGDSATVSSIDPPEGSAQADHCARFYPIARDALLEMHDWHFASRRSTLALLANPSSQWAYCYAAPAECLRVRAVFDADAGDDVATAGVLTRQRFVRETLADGARAIFTHQANAAARYTAQVEDTTSYSPMFVRTLAASLSSMLAGPLLKGDSGTAAALKWQVIAFGQNGRGGWFGAAAASDANQQHNPARDATDAAWLAGR